MAVASLLLLAGAGAAGFVFALDRPMDAAPYLAVHASGEMRDRGDRLLYAFLNESEQWCFERGLDAFSPWLIQATIAVEDQRFYVHHGVDPLAIGRAAVQNVFGRRLVSGASTLTMQVVNLTSQDSRSLPGKLLQAWRALRLERHANKQAILHSYLNNAPYGLNLVGAEAAARRYFGKPASELTLAEAALLAGLPKAPGAYMPLRHAEKARARRNHVLHRMCEEGFITPAQRDEATAGKLHAAWHEFPQAAPHLAMHLRGELEHGGVVRVTLDAALQQRLERYLKRALNRFEGDVTNAAAVVVDVADGSLLARIGGADFYDTPGSGQVDLCRAARSPGSTLKPFVYALAIEADRVYPSEMLLDDTLDFGTYNPGNFDGEYHGLVSATEALQYSLNVPAVTVLQRIGPAAFQGYLRELGLGTLTKESDHYGLGLTLGNCEVRLEELAAAYTALAAEGEFRPLRWRLDAATAEPKRVMTRGTALSIYSMLEQPFPYEPKQGLVRARGVESRVCWKTGTSTGYHDAWTFAFNRQYVVGVWLGNNSGRSSKRLVGAGAALPIAASIFRSLPSRNTPNWPVTGADLRTVAVCAVSGLPASPACTRTRETLLSRQQYLHRQCDVHRTGRAGEGTVERWPGSALSWDLASIQTPVTITPRGENPAPTTRNAALHILSPTDQGKYVLTGEPQGDILQLSASLDAETPLHWYVDGRFIATSRPQEPVPMKLELGQHVVACMSDQGQTHEVHFEVTPPRSYLEFKKKV